ncbi:hypothetical protein BKE38_03385 [Pseudoroseomonas deserti]|uniref:NrtR DNA-binding winged helix domain-containing protein n=1 Tax=Teichococcus deserti TaxID=1817963 RepID=A0A1V2H831_9PROT|nr:NUDIX hydrolase [Pseudoroseomonas deserti]ONG58145.1 hypothetical protein BKE38_03385 [Pseudoroseomonas deserti]
MAEHPTPIATVDIVLLTLAEGRLQVALAPRVAEPALGQPALPGGYVRTEEDAGLEPAARRVLRDKLGMAPRSLEQLASFGGATRDPRGWSISVAFLSVLNLDELAPGPALRLAPVDALPPLPFDHAEIVAAAVRRLRNKASYSALPAFLLPAQFTLAELHRVYEQVLGARLDPASFRRKIEEQRIIIPVGERRAGAHRPARLFALAPDAAREFDRTI